MGAIPRAVALEVPTLVAVGNGELGVDDQLEVGVGVRRTNVPDELPRLAGFVHRNARLVPVAG